MGGLCITTERSPDLQKSIPTKQTHHLQNRHRNKTLKDTIFFYSSLGSYKKTAAQVLSSRGTGRAELNAPKRCTRSTSLLVPQSWARRERFRSCRWASFLDFFSNVGFFEGNSESAYGALCKSIDCHWALRKVYPPVAQLSFEKKNPKNTAIGQSKNPRTVQPWRKRFLQEYATGELRRAWQKMSKLHYFQHSKVYEQGRALVRMPRL